MAALCAFTPCMSTCRSIAGAARLPRSCLRPRRSILPLAAAASSSSSIGDREVVFFDGGPHYGDLVANLVFGLSIVWLPLTVAAVLRALFLRYRFSSARVTILSGLTGGDRKDFGYAVIKDVKYVPRFIGEWGDIVITLRDDTQVELKCIPRFKEIATYCRNRAGAGIASESEGTPKKKGFL